MQKPWLSTTENWKSIRFVFHKDMQQVKKNIAGIIVWQDSCTRKLNSVHLSLQAEPKIV